VTRNAANRTASLAALAAAAGLIWSTAPAWACAPAGGGSGGGDSRQGSESSGYNGAAAEGAREGAADAAAGLDNSGEGGPARASPDTAQDHSGQIGAIGAELAADTAKRCADLQAQLSSVRIAQSNSYLRASDSDQPSQADYARIAAMTPDQLDAGIARARKRGLSPADSKSLSFAMDLRAAQLLGLEDDVKKKYQQQAAAAAQQAAQRAASDAAWQEQTIRDLQSQMAELGCYGNAASAAGATASQ
jgi:hypothetical protein